MRGGDKDFRFCGDDAAAFESSLRALVGNTLGGVLGGRWSQREGWPADQLATLDADAARIAQLDEGEREDAIGPRARRRPRTSASAATTPPPLSRRCARSSAAAGRSARAGPRTSSPRSTATRRASRSSTRARSRTRSRPRARRRPSGSASAAATPPPSSRRCARSSAVRGSAAAPVVGARRMAGRSARHARRRRGARIAQLDEGEIEDAIEAAREAATKDYRFCGDDAAAFESSLRALVGNVRGGVRGGCWSAREGWPDDQLATLDADKARIAQLDEGEREDAIEGRARGRRPRTSSSATTTPPPSSRRCAPSACSHAPRNRVELPDAELAKGVSPPSPALAKKLSKEIDKHCKNLRNPPKLKLNTKSVIRFEPCPGPNDVGDHRPLPQRDARFL